MTKETDRLIESARASMAKMHDYIDRKMLTHMEYLITEIERGENAATKMQSIINQR